MTRGDALLFHASESPGGNPARNKDEEKMKKWILAVAMAAIAVLNAYADTHEKVQLWEGGPYWATTNIGADKPEDYGLYFWWGDTTGHRPSSFNFSSGNSAIYTFGKNVSELKSAGWLTSDGVLAPNHDAAHVQWGGGWRMPTKQELSDLDSKCDWTWATVNGVNGYVIRGRGAYVSNSIFLPLAGYLTSERLTLASSYGCYWSSEPYSGIWYSWSLCFSSSFRHMYNDTRLDGLSIRPVQGIGEESIAEEFIVSFIANGGTGTMESQTFVGGTEQKLSKNTYRKDGYVFQGWAVTANGEVVYKDEALITIDSDMTLYAVWGDPPLTLTAESANWSNGSITLKCEDSDTSGAAHTYSLEYKNESGVWTNVNDVAATSITRSADGFAHLTDNTFWSRLGGIPPVEYRVKDGTGRVSEPLATRTRHGLAIGLSSWGNADLADTGGTRHARMFEQTAQEIGGFVERNIHVYTDSMAKTNDVRTAFSELAEATVPGDVCVIFINTHGGRSSEGNGKYSYLCLYDGAYEDEQLMADIASLGTGVAVVGIVSACHSGGLFDNEDLSDESVAWSLANGLAQCPANVAWITSADAKSSSFGIFSDFLLDYGWRDGLAGGHGSAFSFFDLAYYAKSQYDRLFSGIIFKGESESKQVQIWHEPLLRRITASTNGKGTESCTPLLPPSNVAAAQGKSRTSVDVSWEAVAGADSYWMFFKFGEDGDWIGSYLTDSTSITVYFEEGTSNYRKYQRAFLNTSEATPLVVKVRAINGDSISELSDAAHGWIDSSWDIIFDAGQGYMMGAWHGEIAQLGSPLLTKTMQRNETLILGELPDAVRNGFTLTGWRTLEGRLAYRSMVVSHSIRFNAVWTDMTQDWVDKHTTIATASGGDIATAAAMSAANGCRTVGECYAVGVDPEDPNDDLKISHFEIKDGKPVITLNHTEDGSGNSFLPRVKTLGKSNLSDAEWREVPTEGDPSMHFFKVEVEMP
jgi:uncharacterized repeat protein (TIGR02543 family)